MTTGATQETRVTTEALLRRAHEELARLCAGRGRRTHTGLTGKNWTMTIPRRATDSDEIFADVIERCAELDKRCVRAEAKVSAYQLGWHYHDDDGTWRDRTTGEFQCLDEDLVRCMTAYGELTP